MKKAILFFSITLFIFIFFSCAQPQSKININESDTTNESNTTNINVMMQNGYGLCLFLDAKGEVYIQGLNIYAIAYDLPRYDEKENIGKYDEPSKVKFDKPISQIYTNGVVAAFVTNDNELLFTGFNFTNSEYDESPDALAAKATNERPYFDKPFSFPIPENIKIKKVVPVYKQFFLLSEEGDLYTYNYMTIDKPETKYQLLKADFNFKIVDIIESFDGLYILNENGELYHSKNIHDVEYSLFPKYIEPIKIDIEHIDNISGSDMGICAVAASGNVYCNGYNRYYDEDFLENINLETDNIKYKFILIKDIKNVVDSIHGNNYTIILTEDKKLYYNGKNNSKYLVISERMYKLTCNW